MRKTLRRYLDDAARALRVAPAEVTLGVGVAVLFSLALEGDTGTPDIFTAWTEMALLAGLAGLIAWGATLLFYLDRIPAATRWVITLAGLALAVGYDLAFFDLDRAAEAWRIALLLGALTTGVLVIPAFAAGPGLAERRYHTVNRREVTRVAGVLLYAMLLYAGLAVAIAAVDALFDLDVDGTVYGHVFGWIAFALVPWVVVGGAPDITAPGDDVLGAGDRVVRRYAVWLLVPLLVVYYLIVYAYFIRVAVLSELPSNILSPLVIAAGLLAVGIAQVLESPEERERDVVPDRTGGPDRSWRRHPAVRWAAPLFLPMGVFGAWAILLRVGQYGWTEFRYIRLLALVALGALAVAGTWAVVRRRPLVAWLPPVVVGVALLVGAVGPWGAVAVSRRSQQARLEAVLRDAGAFEGTPIEPVADSARVALPAERYDELRSILSYLDRTHGRASLAAIVDTAALPPWTSRDRYIDLAGELGFSRLPGRGASVVTAALRDPVPTSLLGEGLLDRSAQGGNVDAGARVTVGADSTTVRILREGRAWRADLGPLASWILEQGEGAASPGPGGRRAGANPGAIPIPADRAIVTAEPVGQGGPARLLVLDVTIGPPDSARASPRILFVNAWVVLPPD